MVGSISKLARKHETAIIIYRDSKGESSMREIEPYEIKNGLLYGFCLKRQATRAFKLANIERVVSSGNKFSPRWPIKI